MIVDKSIRVDDEVYEEYRTRYSLKREIGKKIREAMKEYLENHTE